MKVLTMVDTTGPGPDDVVVPANTVGEIVGDGYEHEGTMYVAVDFGNVACDVRLEDLEPATNPVRQVSVPEGTQAVLLSADLAGRAADAIENLISIDEGEHENVADLRLVVAALRCAL